MGNEPETIAPLDPKAPHRVVITFTNDHDVSGASIEVQDVTAEQISVAIFHLTRAANTLADAVALSARRTKFIAANDIGDVAAALQREKLANLGRH